MGFSTILSGPRSLLVTSFPARLGLFLITGLQEGVPLLWVLYEVSEDINPRTEIKQTLKDRKSSSEAPLVSEVQSIMHKTARGNNLKSKYYPPFQNKI